VNPQDPANGTQNDADCLRITVTSEMGATERYYALTATKAPACEVLEALMDAVGENTGLPATELEKREAAIRRKYGFG
jgi:hypothetical protein